MSLNFRDQITMLLTGKTVKVQEIGVRAVTGPLRYESALQLADAIVAWMDAYTPRVEIQTQRKGPSSCKVWFGERLMFDGVSRDALAQSASTPARVALLTDGEMERRLRSALQTYWPESGGQTAHAKAVEAQDRIVREVLR